MSFLLQALELAKIRRGFCAPNPSVGAVIVSESGEVLATGYHVAAGHAHAEVDALKKLNGVAKNATIYITLEPCCHYGRTPPCTDAIIQAGIKHVVYGLMDPNPIVSGKSKNILAEKNITCEYLELPEITEFYSSYRYWHQTKKPFVTAKIAMSLDGKIAGKKGERIQITGSALQHITHAYRKKSDAILTTAKTILHDNPQMNVRDEEVIAKPVYVVDRELNISLDAAIFTTAKSVTLFYGNQLPEDKIKKLSDKNIHKNIRYIAVNAVHEKLDLNEIFTHIGKDGMHDVWVEAGGTFFSELVKEKQVQKMLMYVAPRWLGTGMSAFPEDFSLNLSGKLIHWQQAGDDVFCEVVMT